MDKVTHGIYEFETAQIGAGDDMRVLNFLVEQVQGLMPVSGGAEELGVSNSNAFAESA